MLVNGGILMPTWKCTKCGYTLKSEVLPEECPSCKAKCEFLNNTCYTPDCKTQGIDKRIK